MLYSFPGGVYIDGNRDRTRSRPVVSYNDAAKVKLALKSAYIDFVPCVQPGEYVEAGQIIAESEQAIPLRAPISGTAAAQEDSILPDGRIEPCFVIINDFSNTFSRPIIEGTWRNMTKQQICDVIRSAGIFEKGGEPAVFKINRMLHFTDTLIVRGFDDEPWIASAHRTVCDYAQDVIEGIEVIAAVFGTIRTIIALCDETGEAEESVRRANPELASLRVVQMCEKYPQADEKLLISAITGRNSDEIQKNGTLVFSAQTMAAIGRALRDGMPQLTAIVTVAGDAIANARTVEAPVGTSYGELAGMCGGYLRTPGVIIPGGAMRSPATFIDDVPVLAGDDAFTALLYDNVAAHGECIRCGRCAAVCPYGLMPGYIRYFAETGDKTRCGLLGADRCTLCGACSYVCPSHIDLTGVMRTLKNSADSRQ